MTLKSQPHKEQLLFHPNHKLTTDQKGRLENEEDCRISTNELMDISVNTLHVSLEN